MTAFTNIPKEIERVLKKSNPTTSRRNFLKGSGLFVVSLSTATLAKANPFGTGSGAQAAAGAAAGPYPDRDFHELDSWIVIHEDSTATFYVGKTDGGQGTGTAFRQMMSDELDIAFDKTDLIMGRTDITVDQGGSGGSDAIQTDGWPMRRVAAEARRVLLEMAAERFGVPVGGLAVSEGVITVTADPSRNVSYGDLIGDKRFNVTLTGNRINDTAGVADVKPVGDLKAVGQSLKRYDIPPKVDGSLKWAVSATAPGMVHARNVRPPVIGATLISIDESSVRDIPGLVRIVSKGNYIAVVYEREENAIKAAGQLKVNWQEPTTAPFPASEDLFTYMRNATPTSLARTRGTRTVPEAVPNVEADPDQAFAQAAKVIEAEYDFPFQGHTAIGPAHAMADPSNDQMTIYSNDMKSYGMRNGLAPNFWRCRGTGSASSIWKDPRCTAAPRPMTPALRPPILAKEIGRPVRVQWMRHEETAWDTKGPAFTFNLRGGLDAEGNLIALDYRARTADYAHVGYNDPETVLIAQLMGIRPARTAARRSLPALGTVCHPEPAPADARRAHAPRLRDPAAYRKLEEIPTGHRRRSPANRSSTNS